MISEKKEIFQYNVIKKMLTNTVILSGNYIGLVKEVNKEQEKV
jgi:hypothetical protein